MRLMIVNQDHEAMTMNSEKLVRLERMGLGPVWQLRARADEPVAVDATSSCATLVAADFSALDWDEIRGDDTRLCAVWYVPRSHTCRTRYRRSTCELVVRR
jgi:hypothetical protein